MNIRDLRPGNLIRWVHTNEIVTVTGVFEDKREVTARKTNGTNVEDIIDAFDGVVISEELLYKSGFEYLDYRDKWQLPKCSFQIFDGDFEGKDIVIGATEKLSIIFFHDLQNVFYYLNNKKELEFTSLL